MNVPALRKHRAWRLLGQPGSGPLKGDNKLERSSRSAPPTGGADLLFGGVLYREDRQERLGSVLVTLRFTQNLVSIFFCQLGAVKRRFASALDRPNQAARHIGQGAPVQASQGQKWSEA
jgi:hypothetical protein